MRMNRLLPCNALANSLGASDILSAATQINIAYKMAPFLPFFFHLRFNGFKSYLMWKEYILPFAVHAVTSVWSRSWLNPFWIVRRTEPRTRCVSISLTARSARRCSFHILPGYTLPIHDDDMFFKRFSHYWLWGYSVYSLVIYQKWLNHDRI